MILVTGATGNVGQQVALGLSEAGELVRGMSRTAGPGLVKGDLFAPEGLPLDGVDKVFLLWPGPTAEGIQEAVDAIAGQVKHVVYLSAISAESGFWGVVENALRASGVEWTFLQAGGFASNTRMWADMIRRDGEVRWPYGAAARSLIHERDIADVAVQVLTTDGHAGQTYLLTGPEAISQAEQVRQIGAAIGRPLRWTEQSPDEARAQLLAEWGNPAFVDGALSYWASLVGDPEQVTGTVEQITGTPARTFEQWARDHADDFR
ncbi:MAG TPA: hypothetical protein VGP57_12260 [Actinoplanes sp.]|nr:hypothetical protein [Actinoplanes sp.]